METVMIEQQKNKIHPHKFTLWVGIGSILMMFAGLTSAYIVKRNMANWISFELPNAFWISTAVVALSSVVMVMAVKAFKNRRLSNYRLLLLASFVLGLIFIFTQILGFSQLVNQGVSLGKTSSVDFLYVIVGLHALHVLGGVIVLIVMLLKAFSAKTRTYAQVPVDLISTYWHFVGILWAYLLIFLIMIK